MDTMKRNNKLLRQLLSIIICISAVLLIFKITGRGHLFGLAGKGETAKFQSLCQEMFLIEMSDDSLSLHFTLRNPESYGVENKQVSLPLYSKQDMESHPITLENTIKRLKKTHRNSLSPEYKYNYDVFNYSLKSMLEGCKYPYFEEPFSPFSGLQTEFPLLLSEYTFSTKKDVENYLKILECSGPYLNSLNEYEKEKSAAGLFMSDSEAERVIAWCDTFISSYKDHILVTTFIDKVNALEAQGEISASEKKYYLSQNERLLTTVLFPAYEKLGDCLTVLKGSGKALSGLCQDEGGKKYYEYLVKSTIGTDKSIKEIKSMLTKQLQEDFTKLHTTVLLLSEGEYEGFEDPLTALEPEQILEDLKSRMALDFSSTDNHYYSYVVKDVAESLEAYTSPAFYFTPPIDAVFENVIYVNNATTEKGIDLYTTLAHEGFPGHLYQSVTFQSHSEEASLPDLRSILYWGGYIEGYATYTEMISYEYAKACAAGLSPNSADSTSTIYDAVALDRSIQLCLYSLLDIMIHYEGMGTEEIAPYLHNFGITDSASIQAVFSYIASEPANYLKYYGGYLEILECQSLAKQAWGNAYSDHIFHEFLLNLGPSPFPLIKKAIQDYIPDGFIAAALF